MGKATLRLVSSISATYKRMRVYQRIERFSTDDCPKSKQLLRPITTGAGSAMNQSQFLAIILNSKRGKDHAYMVRLVLVLVLRLIG